MSPKSSLPDENSTLSSAYVRHAEVPRLDAKVLLVGSCFLSGAISMFAEAGCTRAASVDDADLVCYLGGEDVDPSLYGEKPLRGTYFNRLRDEREVDIFTKALAAGKTQVGICRGMQLLHVLNGGKLWQHVVNHANGRDHEIVSLLDGRRFTASSMHHQMCIENASTFPIAYAATKGQSGVYYSAGRELSSNAHNDLEAAAYPNIGAIAVQGHPEVAGTPEYTAWFIEIVRDFMRGSFAESITAHQGVVN